MKLILNFLQITSKGLIIFFILVILLTILFLSGCGLNPVPAPNIISGADSLFAPKNGNASFTFSGKGETYGSFQLSAFVSYAYLSTPQGGGIQKSSENLTVAPDTGYTASVECGFYYYYLIADIAPHYAKILINSYTNDQNGITIKFNWWLQTEAGERNFQ